MWPVCVIGASMLMTTIEEVGCRRAGRVFLDALGNCESLKSVKRCGIYLRVSTDQQTTENQRRILLEVAERSGWEVVAIFEDQGISGAKGRDQRPGFDALLKAVSRREIDMVAAWSVDRLGRSLPHLIGLLGDLEARGCDLFLHQQALDTSTPTGRAMFAMAGVFAELERSLISARVRSGQQRARANGVRFGRPPIPPIDIDKVKVRLTKGQSIRVIAKATGMSTASVMRIKRSMVLAPQAAPVAIDASSAPRSNRNGKEDDLLGELERWKLDHVDGLLQLPDPCRALFAHAIADVHPVDLSLFVTHDQVGQNGADAGFSEGTDRGVPETVEGLLLRSHSLAGEGRVLVAKPAPPLGDPLGPTLAARRHRWLEIREQEPVRIEPSHVIDEAQFNQFLVQRHDATTVLGLDRAGVGLPLLIAAIQ